MLSSVTGAVSFTSPHGCPPTGCTTFTRRARHPALARIAGSRGPMSGSTPRARDRWVGRSRPSLPRPCPVVTVHRAGVREQGRPATVRWRNERAGVPRNRSVDRASMTSARQARLTQCRCHASALSSPHVVVEVGGSADPTKLEPTEGAAHVSRPCPQLLHLARRLRDR